MPRLTVNGVDLAYDEAGTGPAVVMIHAGIADRRMWNHQFDALASAHRVIRYDWRAHGESGDSPEPFAHYRDLLGLMDALGVQTAALVGCSMGGSYAVEATLTAPDRVTGLVLVCSGLSGHVWPETFSSAVRTRVHSSVPAERLKRYLNLEADYVDPADVDAMARAQARFMVAGPGRDPGELDPQAWALAIDMLRGVFRRNWTAERKTERQLEPPANGRLSEVRTPTLVINGLSDVPEIQAVSDLLTRGISGARRLDMPRTGHLPPLERPVEVTTAIQEFLGEG